jgi:preprotein translocase subunit SecG
VPIAYMILLGLEVLLGLLLVALILLHPPKGEGMGGIGGAATLFTGKRSAETGLDRFTYMVAAAFMLVLAILGFGLVRP